MKTKIAIGCLVQWYEFEIISEYVKTLEEAISHYDGEVVVDFRVVTNEDLEKCISSEQKEKCINSIKSTLNNFDVVFEDRLYTIADYRREFNDRYCDEVDVLVWGETDMLVPISFFQLINSVYTNVNVQTPKWIMTFGICKMWDTSWRVLEHPNFTKMNHSDNKDDWWSVRYTNTVDEMNEINQPIDNGIEQPELIVLPIGEHKFNGCGLVISSEVVKSGVNIPKSVFFVHEDTAFLHMIQKMIPQTVQYHIRNVYLPHNRKHPKKRKHIKGEDGIDKTDMGRLRKSHIWYETANKLSEKNCYNLFNPKYKSKTWKDVFNGNT